MFTQFRLEYFCEIDKNIAMLFTGVLIISKDCIKKRLNIDIV